MTDWSKLKVTELKEECKSREIPMTGLKLKQQFIDALQEHEANSTSIEEPAEKNGDQEEAAQEESTITRTSIGEQPAETELADDPNLSHGRPEPSATEQQSVASANEGEAAEAEVPAELSEVQASHADDEQSISRDEEMLEPETRAVEDEASKAETEEENHASKPSYNEQRPAKTDAGDRITLSKAEREQSPGSREPIATPPTQVASFQGDTGTPASARVPATELVEDQNKRKRRSVTPTPDTDDIAHKKAKSSNGVPITTKSESSALDQIQNATNSSQAIRDPDGLGHPNESMQGVQGDESGGVVAETRKMLGTDAMASNRDTDPSQSTLQVQSPPQKLSRSPSPDRDIAPAVHPATSSLYIRNFKRPLNIPSLRGHILSLAQRPGTSSSEDPIIKFYLDNIRTHAFVSFSSVSAAARVRSAMHETRFPDEPLREPLFIDFIPNDKVQAWIDQESSGGGFGRGGGGRRYEVLYDEGPDGIEASLQEIDAARPQPQMQAQRSRISETPKLASAPTSLHPDRAVLVPEDSHASERRPPPKADTSGGTGFKALDDLFSSTTTKPKLYYKPASAGVAESRLGMIRDLRLNQGGRGKTGDEGMKRYTFETYKSREEWVDKGPEFGFGRKGQDRLTGRGRGGSGYRGRGGGRYLDRDRPGDSWRR